MSESKIYSGYGLWDTEISKLAKEAKITASFNDFDIYDFLRAVSSFSECTELTVILNIKSDEKINIALVNGDTIRYRERVEFLERSIKTSVNSSILDRKILLGIGVCRKLLANGKFKLLVNPSNINHGQRLVMRTPSGYTEIIGNASPNLTSTGTLENLGTNTYSTLAIKKYFLGESINTALESSILEEINNAGKSVESDFMKHVDSYIHIHDSSIDSLYRSSLYVINKHHINSELRQTELLDSIKKAEFRFQTDGVDSLISILTKYRIAYLADSVGLGKTIIALRLLAKTKYKAVVILPTDVVLHQWKEYILESEGLFQEGSNISFMLNNYQALDKFITKDIDDYDIVIFDEAHNFRNMDTLRYKRAQEICSGKQVLLLGATPVNNGIEDVEAQLMLGLNPSQSYDFGVGPIGVYLTDLKKSTRLNKSETAKYRKAQEEAGRNLRNMVISKLMVRRTRADIKKYYQEDIESGRLHFPKVNKPILVSYKYTGTKLANTLDILSGYNYRLKLTYALYNKSRYKVKKQTNSDKEQLGLIDVENLVESVENLGFGDLGDSQELELELPGNINMTGLTKVRLIKLLDSSPYAFITSLIKMIEAINAELDTLNTSTSTKKPFQHQQSMFTDELTIKAKDSNDENVTYSNQYLKDLENDRDVLMELVDMWMEGKRVADSDIKVKALQQIIDNNPNRKVIIFTEYIATAEGVCSYLKSKGYRVLKIDGRDKKSKTKQLLENFSISGNQSNSYDILVSTNILSEGINLNRASIAVNYDITWNPMMIVQRVGRLDRLDSVVDEIDVYNFFPCDEMDGTLLSESNIISKYALAMSSIGCDENYLYEQNKVDASMMEYKQSIISSMQTSIVEQQFDFRSVDFRYSDEAIRVFNSKEVIDSLIAGTHIATVEKAENEIPQVIALFKIRGNITACSLNAQGFKFIDFNEFLDYCNKHLNSKVLPCNSKVFNSITAITKEAKQRFKADVTLTKSQSELYMMVDRLENNLANDIESEGIENIEVFEILRTLRIIKHNIKNNLLNTWLCKWYGTEFMDELRSNQLDTIQQSKILINTVLKRRFTVLHEEYDSTNTFKLLSFLCIV